MTEAIHVQVAREVDGVELVGFLETHGLAGELVRANDHFEVEVGYGPAEQERLQAQVWDTITSWLAESGRPLVPTAIGEREYALTPPGE